MTSASGRQPPPRRVICVDWGGVISDDEFWLSLRQAGHPLKEQVDAGMHRIWHEKPGISRAWMRGFVRFGEVIAEMGIAAAGSGFLRQALQSDAQAMCAHPGIARLLPAWAGRAQLVLATDNVEPFAAAFEGARASGARRAAALATMADLTPWFTAVICSCDGGTLKSEDPRAFFGPWLAGRGLGPGDALLVDDRADNCEAFTAMGGSAVRWHLRDDARRLEEPVSAWLSHGAISR